MKVVIAIDSLKGSLSSTMAGNVIKQGINNVIPNANVVVKPLADGGEGTVEALVNGMGGYIEKVIVLDPLGKKIESSYGIIKESNTAIIEMAMAAGLTLVPENLRNPLNATTYGVGQLIKDAISKGIKNFIIGIGGSATNDGGIGMLQSLGFDFLDSNNNQIELGAKGIKNLVKIETKNKLKELDDCTFNIACDVNNPLCGANGSSAIYGPQKGATPDMVEELDNLLKHYASLTSKLLNKDNSNVDGVGAAGGIGFAFLSFLNANLQSGIQIILKYINLENEIKDANIVITGEGRLDNQTAMGKAPIGVAKLAKKYNKTVIAFSGCATEDAKACNKEGIDAYFPIIQKADTLENLLKEDVAKENLLSTTEQVFNLIKILRGE
ncbi:glycerate kinase [[Clostridium] colinum]|uniref:glycerate kinase n=1 Tax=[Clostridium] colinum TaxID=36835 RepID=UPI0020249985|nr:glycerate kinase [[Clostridium] colinum]